ncbi:MAG: leucine-rich repeat domain-containing protein [Clostridia bacterium]|nr:leucine-rich repeat domain-containing protein [Clostridia bacterium]
MKKFRLFIFFSLIICCFLAFAGCAPALPRPTDLKIDQDTLTLSWKEVETADYYTVSINGEENDSSKNAYSLAKLTAGEYTIKVKACGEDYKDSKWSEAIPFDREAESGMIFKLINNGTEYEVSNLGTASGDIVVPDEYRGRPVTSIGKKAFAKKPLLTSVKLGENIKTIGEQAFFQCTYLKTINIPAGVTSIGAKAFQSCVSLESDIVIPEGVTSLEESVFGYCENITNVTIGSNVKTIKGSAFTDCTKISKIVIPDSVESIGEYAFSSCTEATELTIGKGVLAIGKNAFYNCTKLTEIVMGEKVQVLDVYAFAKCAELVSVTFSDSVKEIGAGAFMDCVKLATINLGSGIEGIGYVAFYNTALWNAAENMVYVGKWLVDCKVKDAGIYQIAEGTIGIGGSTFYKCNTFSQMIIPDSVKIIDDAAFESCAQLTNVVIGAGCERIDDHAFFGCVNLQYVQLGAYDFDLQEITSSSLKSIGYRAFYGCTLLSSIVIPETVEIIKSYAFRKTDMYKKAESGSALVYAGNWLVDFNQDGVISSIMGGGDGNFAVADGTVGVAEYAFFNAAYIFGVSFPESVKTISRAAFYQAANIEKVTLPSTLKRIEEYTFYGCPYLFEIELPQELEYIGRSAFYECSFMGCGVSEDGTMVVDKEATLVIPDSVKTIEDYAFYRCGYMATDRETGEVFYYGIDNLVLGNGVKSIGINSFNKFFSLKNVTIGSGLESVGEKAFYTCPALETVTIGSSVKKIENRAFYGCASLKSVTIPANVETIEKYAFYKCSSLQSITLEEGVKVIGDYAFSGCTKLKTLILPDSLTSIGKQAFRNSKALKSVTLSKNLVTMANHAFYGCTNMTVYTEYESIPEGWSVRWNSSYQPVIWGVTLSEEGYVASFTKTAESVTYVDTLTAVNGPEFSGKTFVGWATVAGSAIAEITPDALMNVADGTVLYAVWTSAN